jgi:hypothetical protein
MGMDLRNAKRAEYHLPTLGWAFYLNLAERYGWEPTGTQPPELWDTSEGPWEGHYDWNASQRVMSEDAASLAAALGRYLADPQRVSVAKLLAIELGEAVGVEVSFDENDEIGSFIAFARSGPFEIW